MVSMALAWEIVPLTGESESAARPRQDLLAQGLCYRLTPTIAFVRAWAFEDDPSDPVAAAQSAYILNQARERSTGAGA